MVTDAVRRLELPRLTIDVDGTVVCTGATVGWAFRGFNPHHRKDPSYYPLLAHLAQTGHILRLKNRPGNVHDSTQAVELPARADHRPPHRFGRRVVLEFRMDAAFFQRNVFRLLARRGCGYAIKVGYWSWLPLKRLAAETRHWVPVAPDVTACDTTLDVHQWNLRLRVMLYRRHVAAPEPPELPTRSVYPRRWPLRVPRRGHEPDPEPAGTLRLHRGRGAQEKTIAELKGEFALDVVPTKDYTANSAWQQLSILAHNWSASFQLDTLAEPKPRSRKRTYAYLFRSMRTLRFLLIARAGRLTRIGGRQVLRLAENPATEVLYGRIAQRLAA